MTLNEYRRKRDFRKTTEPAGKRSKSRDRLTFVVQKHAASHLHYDFRLELNGVLLSWAVPKGPSLNPANKRLAMHVEDHPLDYGGFEGTIPKGEYGGGTVMLWDRGTWNPDGDAAKGYRDGSLKFELHGIKLKGKWVLVRRGGKKSPADERHWFLIKERDKYATAGTEIVDLESLSVATGRDLEEIATASETPPRKKNAKRKKKPAAAGKKGTNRSKKKVTRRGVSAAAKTSKRKRSKRADSMLTVANSVRLRRGVQPNTQERAVQRIDRALQQALRSIPLRGTPSAALSPEKIRVQVARLADTPPTSDEWIHEIKLDGYRMLGYVENGETQFISRNHHDWTERFPSLTKRLAALPVKSALLDGEVVALSPDGSTSFQALQNVFQKGREAELYYFAFDLLYLNGQDLRPLPIEDRKKLLELIIPTTAHGRIRLSEHVVGQGEEFYQAAAERGLEGIISKRRGRPYMAGRGNDWLKIKASQREEFVIGGFSKPGGSRQLFGSLLLGYYDKSGHLLYAGRVGTGFDRQSLREVYNKLIKLERRTSPFSSLSKSDSAASGVTWTAPKLVAQIEFSNWTEDRLLRHPSFQGLREDKPAKQVHQFPQPLSNDILQETAKMPMATKSNRKRQAASANEFAGVQLSSPDKVLYPDDGYTKADLARYYESIADWILPHVENRLLSLVRCPAGRGKKCFFQKHPTDSDSEYLIRHDVTEKKGTDQYVSINNLSGMMALVQMGVLEIHTWGSRVDNIERPDRLILDLDPDLAVPWPQVVEAAREVKQLLEALDLTSFVKTTGGKGLHVVIPIQRRTSWDDAKAFCQGIARQLEARHPERYVANMRKALRKGKIFVDFLRNDRGATAIAPYSLRAREGAPASVPLSWNELSNKIRSDHFTIRNLPARLAKLRQDPWSAIFGCKQSITAKLLNKILRATPAI